MKNAQEILNKREEMLTRLNQLTREEIKELVDIEMELSDNGFDVESHEDLWINS